MPIQKEKEREKEKETMTMVILPPQGFLFAAHIGLGGCGSPGASDGLVSARDTLKKHMRS